MKVWVALLVVGCGGASTTTTTSELVDVRTALCRAVRGPLSIPRARTSVTCDRLRHLAGIAALPEGPDLEFGLGCVEAYYVGPDFPGVYPMFDGALRALTQTFPSLRYTAVTGGGFLLTTPKGNLTLGAATDSDELILRLAEVAARVRRDLPAAALGASPEQVLLDGALRSLAWPGRLYSSKLPSPTEDPRATIATLRADRIAYVKPGLQPGLLDTVREGLFGPVEARGVVLDLRGVEEFPDSDKVADLFLSGGCIVTRRTGRITVSTYAHHNWSDVDIPLLVLVDETTAADAEVTAAALQANERALIAGHPTSGRATVSVTVRTLPSKATMRVATGLSLRPDGRPLQGNGVAPDLEVPAGQDAVDWAAQVLLGAKSPSSADLRSAASQR